MGRRQCTCEVELEPNELIYSAEAAMVLSLGMCVRQPLAILGDVLVVLSTIHLFTLPHLLHGQISHHRYSHPSIPGFIPSLVNRNKQSQRLLHQVLDFPPPPRPRSPTTALKMREWPALREAFQDRTSPPASYQQPSKCIINQRLTMDSRIDREIFSMLDKMEKD